MNNRTLIITDNFYLYTQFKKIVEELKLNLNMFDFGFSTLQFKDDVSDFKLINIKTQVNDLVQNYNLIISLHSKQLFPQELVKKIRCINIHPGFNPYNRGWYPQVFSIINKFPIGATIHEIDGEIDHGKIIAQKKVDVQMWDTSLSLYDKVISVELELIREFLPSIIKNEYKSFLPSFEGNLNLKKDFNNLCEIDLNEQIRAGDFIDKLRALTHGIYKNAYFIDKITGKKIYLSIMLKTES